MGTSQNLLDYIWEKQFKLSFGYSFSSLHTTGYSLIALQEMNLAYHYPIIYWNCACLSVDSSAIDAADFYKLLNDEIIEVDDEEEKRAQNKMDYAKLASALDRFDKICKIKLPDINNSKLSFTPNVQENSILYGLKGISRITNPVIEEIMSNRPFNSFDDFYDRITKRVVTKDKIVNLIKCGAFNSLENKNAKEILTNFLSKTCEPKSKLTMANFNMLIDENILPQELEYEKDLYKLTKELRTHRDSCKVWYFVESLNMPEDKIDSWKGIFFDSGIEGKELIIDGGHHKVIDSSLWDKFYKNRIEKAKKYITDNQKTLLEKLNNGLFEKEFNKYCGSKEGMENLKWELDSLNFYFTEHPLKKVAEQINQKIGLEISDIEDIVEGKQDGEFYIKGKIIPKMQLYSLVGTVIDRNKTKGTVTIQCPTGVVDLKVYKDLYATMSQVIVTNEDIEQDSFFEKGVHLLVTGIQRGSTFIPKVYKNSGVKSIMKINLNSKGDFISLESKK